jgi:hypothetical protein
MYCFHCEGDLTEVVRVGNKTTEDKYFCCKPCAFVYLRQIYEPDMRDTIRQFKNKAEKLALKIETDHFYIEKMKILGIYTKQAAIDCGHMVKENPHLSDFEFLADDLAYTRLEHRMCVLLVKTTELLLERKSKLYPLFKTKLLDVWDELLAKSPNDMQSVQIADLVTCYYQSFKAQEPAFGL